MTTIERTNRIIRQRAKGGSVSEIAAAEAMSSASVRTILSRHRFCITEREPPSGLSIRSAWYVEQSLGIWPSESNAEEIAVRKIEFLRAPGTTMRFWREIEGWIDTIRQLQPG